MPVEILLPRVDMDMTHAKLTHWFAAEGSRVEKGRPLFEIETDKSAMEVDAPASGWLRDISANPGDDLPIGTVIGQIFADGEAVAPPPAAVARARATPAARRLAREAKLDWAALRGTGPLGRVQARDVPAPLQAPVGGAPVGGHREWLARGTKPPLVLIHGFGADLNVWRRWLGRFPAGRGALALDLPGHGRSPLGARVEIDAFADEAAATLAAEGVGFAHIVAHSLGAAVAVALAAQRPDLVGSLTLIAPAGFGPDMNGAFLTGFLQATSAAPLARWLAELVADPAVLGEGLAEQTLRLRRDRDLGSAQAHIAAALLPDGTQVFESRAALGACQMPVKAIFGREDRIVPVAHARQAPAGVAVHVLPGVGHMPHWEERDLVTRLAADNAAAGDARRLPA